VAAGASEGSTADCASMAPKGTRLGAINSTFQIVMISYLSAHTPLDRTLRGILSAIHSGREGRTRTCAGQHALKHGLLALRGIGFTGFTRRLGRLGIRVESMNNGHVLHRYWRVRSPATACIGSGSSIKAKIHAPAV
jgi:hypothetical protein